MIYIFRNINDIYLIIFVISTNVLNVSDLDYVLEISGKSTF